MSQTPSEALREMGAEFHHAARFLTETVTAADTALAKRMQHLAVCISEARGRLAYHQEEIRILPEQIGKWEAERARLESQTGLDLLRQALEPVREEKPTEERGPVFGPEDHERCHYCKGLFLKPVEYHHTEEECAFLTSQVELGAVVLHPQPPGEVIEAPLTQPKPEPYRSGLPPERLRKVWAEWEMVDGVVCVFQGNKYRCTYRPPTEWWDIGAEHTWRASYRPHGATWAEVEAMADERGPYCKGSWAVGNNCKTCWRCMETKPKEATTLLDLTKLPPGTVCEATADIPIIDTPFEIPTGERFTIRTVLQKGALPVEVHIGGQGDDWWLPDCVPARVVKEGGEDAPR